MISGWQNKLLHKNKMRVKITKRKKNSRQYYINNDGIVKSV